MRIHEHSEPIFNAVLPSDVALGRSESGFTLLEIMVVMVLIALLTAAAINTINFAVSDVDAKTEAQRIVALGTLAAEEALLTGREYGMRIDDDELHFLLFDEASGQWQPLTDADRVFRPRPIPETLSYELVLEGQAVKLDDSEPADDPDEDVPEPPQLMFLSSGEVTPFTLTIADEDGETWTVEGDLLGRMEITGEPQ